MSRHASSLCALVLMASCALVSSPAAAFAAVPDTALGITPAADGLGGWWRTVPVATAVVDQDATLHYVWGATETVVGVSAGVPLEIGSAPEGVTVLRAWAVSGEGAGTAKAVVLKTDSVAPDRPATLSSSFAAGGVSLSWPGVSDASPGSGLAGYRVYRNLGGWPFADGDLVAFATSNSYVDPEGYGPYSYAVRAVDAAGGASLMSDVATTPSDTTSPTAPGGVTAWRNAMPAVRVAWTPSIDGGSGVAGYGISRSIGGGAPVHLDDLSAESTWYDDLEPIAYGASDVVYTVTATDRMGNAMAASASPETDTAAPATPTGLSRTIEPGALALAWDASTDPTSGVGGYWIYRNLGGAPFAQSDRLAFVTGTSYHDPDAYLQTYRYAVQAVDTAGNESGVSGAIVGWMDDVSPVPPSAFGAWRRGTPTTHLQWDPASDVHSGLDRYTVTRTIGGGAPVTLATLASDATSFDDLELGAYEGADVVYEVTAYDRAGNSAGSSAAPQADTDGPSTPAGLARQVLSDALRVTWDASTDSPSGVLGYHVYRNTVGPPFATGDRIGFVTDTSFLDRGAPGHVWRYAVQAVDRAGNVSAISAALVGWMDVTPPSAPADAKAWRAADQRIHVSWAPSADADSGLDRYVLARSLDGGAPVALATLPASATGFVDADAASFNAGTVVYTITALDTAGNAAASSVQALTDLSPPVVTPPVLRAVGELPARPGVLGADVAVRCAAATDDGSGVSRYELLYGPDPGVPAHVETLSGAGEIILPAGSDGATWYVRVRATDGAGNVATSAPSGIHVATADRAAGADRLLTALAVSQATFTSSRAVVFANAWNFPDALAASGLAGALRAPILLVGPGPLPATTLAELKRLGARDGYVVGGPPAVSVATYDSIRRALSGETTRVAGPDRYATAAAVARAVAALKGRPSRTYLVSGENFPDALSAGPAAYAEAAPVLFARASSLPAATSEALRDVGATQTVILGSPVAVWSGVESSVPGPVRVAGSTRYGTSVAFARWAIAQRLLTPARPLLATGRNFPDGLAAAPVGGERRSPVLLVPDALGEAGAVLEAEASGVSRVTAIGSEVVVPAATLRDAWLRVQVTSLTP